MLTHEYHTQGSDSLLFSGSLGDALRHVQFPTSPYGVYGRYGHRGGAGGSKPSSREESPPGRASPHDPPGLEEAIAMYRHRGDSPPNKRRFDGM